MRTAEEIQTDIEALPRKEYMQLVRWFSERDWKVWDREIEIDSKSGRLDFLIEEAFAEKKVGKLRSCLVKMDRSENDPNGGHFFALSRRIAGLFNEKERKQGPVWDSCSRYTFSQTASKMHPEFPLSPDVLYLNHAAVAPWPRRTVAAVTRFAQESGTRGAADYANWIGTETRLRQRLAELIKAPSSLDVALVKNTSEGLSVIAYGIDWKPGDNVVGIAQEFPSNRIVWESLGTQDVAYRQLNLHASSQPEADLMALCDERTHLMALSSVQYARGLRLDLERLGDFCRSRNILFCVDAIQSLGVVPFDLARTKADFVVADGHKWMLGPEGMALLYVNPRLRPKLRLHQYGWHMVEHRGDYERLEWSPAADARRFECGSPNMLGAHALDASLSLLLETGIDRIRATVAERTQRLVELIDGHGFELLSPRDPERRAGIVTFRVPGADHQALYQALTGSGVICARRGGGIRFSPHFYTPHSVLKRAVRITAEVAAG